MPIYNYKCDTCGNTFEIKQSINDKPLEFCPEENCKNESDQRGSVRRVISKNIGLVFNGSGFYLTDYANGKGKSTPSSDNTKKSEKTSDVKPAVAS